MKWLKRLFSKEKKNETATEPLEPRWFNVAYKFLVKYCKEHETFYTKDVRLAAEKEGLPSPINSQAWGGVVLVASNNELIEGLPCSNDSLKKQPTLWKSKIYKDETHK